MGKKSLTMDLSDSLVSLETRLGYTLPLEKNLRILESGEYAYSGWVKLPFGYDKKEFKRIEAAAQRIQDQCDILVVLGIGGSYLGARAAIEMLYNEKGGYPKIFFAGHTFSASYHHELMRLIENQNICLCVISKSGTTTETGIAFALLKDWMTNKYGTEETRRRIYVVTDATHGILREEVRSRGYESFAVPDDIGGRYSVLTPVGLLPIKAAGIDIKEIMSGASDMAAKRGYSGPYAAVRQELFKRGRHIEIFEYYEPRLRYFAEWLKQLFGESEGKEGKGIFPASLEFSTDLHSMGQYLQEGSPIFFETVLDVMSPPYDLDVPESAEKMLAGKSMNRINQAALEGVMAAHRQASIPMLRMCIPSLTPYCFGQMVYFFEMACALSGLLSGVDPFNQPGVERYKEEMRKGLQRQDIDE